MYCFLEPNSASAQCIHLSLGFRKDYFYVLSPVPAGQQDRHLLHVPLHDIKLSTHIKGFQKEKKREIIFTFTEIGLLEVQLSMAIITLLNYKR
jgi:hypothetical protein